MHDIEQLIAARRTIHQFKPQPIPPREEILRAIDLARWAPNHRLTEPWRFHLIGPETAQAICRLKAELVRAQQSEAVARSKLERWRAMPGWLAVTCVKSADPVREREDYAACCCAIQNLYLLLWQRGIGLKWNTGRLVRDPRFYELLKVRPDEATVVGLFWYGYAADVPLAKRRPVEEDVQELP
jgi:nitroreductase